VLSDGATLLDPHELTDAMTDAFIEIRRAAGLPEELTVSNRYDLIVGSAGGGASARRVACTHDKNSSTA